MEKIRQLFDLVRAYPIQAIFLSVVLVVIIAILGSCTEGTVRHLAGSNCVKHHTPERCARAGF